MQQSHKNSQNDYNHNNYINLENIYNIFTDIIFSDEDPYDFGISNLYGINNSYKGSKPNIYPEVSQMYVDEANLWLQEHSEVLPIIEIATKR